MSGYFHGQRVYNLDFSDTELDGLTVKARGCSINERLQLQKQGDEQVVALFAERLLEWNLLDEFGQSVPIDREYWGTQDADLIMTIATTWLREVSSVRRPLGRRSNNGHIETTMLMDTIPTESL